MKLRNFTGLCYIQDRTLAISFISSEKFYPHLVSVSITIYTICSFSIRVLGSYSPVRFCRRGLLLVAQQFLSELAWFEN